MLYFNHETCSWVAGFFVFFGESDIKLKKSNQNTAFCVWKKNWRVLFLHFQNKVLKNRISVFSCCFSTALN